MKLHATSIKDVLDEQTLEEKFISETKNLVFFRQMMERSYDHFRKTIDKIHIAFVARNS